MPFFNFRRASSPPPNAAAVQPESMDVIRKRAKHRLIGAAVLVLVGVVGFPLLFDTQPRPIAIDIPIEIPGKNTVKPLTMPAQESTTPAPVPDQIATASSLGVKEEVVADKKPAIAVPAASVPKKEVEPAAKLDVKPEAKPVAKPLPKPESKVEAKPESTPTPKGDDGARAKALLSGQAPAAAGVERVVVQVGAFADAGKAHEVRTKLEKAGLKTYTQVVETKDGKRVRVRVGPFDSKAAADKAASKIKTLDLPAAILTL